MLLDGSELPHSSRTITQLMADMILRLIPNWGSLTEAFTIQDAR